jgi:pteridine reductase
MKERIMQESLFATKVALITGAARRVGAELARVLHHAGMNIALHYHTSEEAAKELCERMNQIRHHSAVALQADLLEIESVQILVTRAAEQWQRLDVLVNNASRYYSAVMGEITEDAWDDLMNSNLKAPFFLAQTAMPFLAASKGCIVNITDIHAERALRDYAVYCISKSGLMMMTKVLAKELGPNIRVNAVAPGAVLWPEGENTLSAERQQKIIKQTSLKRTGTPNDIAKAVLFFVRDADYITGQILSVDGGRLLFN